MDLTQIPLFALADRRLAWVAQRQSVLASNIANADTPNWKSRDVAPFMATLNAVAMPLAVTAEGHLQGAGTAMSAVLAPSAERAPDGNTVVLDKELAKVADTDNAHELAIGLTKSYLGMFRTAIGK